MKTKCPNPCAYGLGLDLPNEVRKECAVILSQAAKMTMEFLQEAKKKVAEGQGKNLGRYEDAMKRSVGDALLDFCQQDAEFAQAVAQGGSFEDCMKAVAKHVKGNAISDMEAWGAAVKFYFPGAEIRVKMEIDLCASVRADGPKQGPVIDLSEFF